jgi:TPR repeat protein
MAEEGYFIIHDWVSGTLEDAFNYFQKAVEAGYKKAHYGVAECYLYGWGVEQNYEKAKYHFEKIGKGNILKGITAENIKEKIDGDRTLKNDREFYN